MAGAWATVTIIGMVAVTDGVNDVTGGAAAITVSLMRCQCPMRNQFKVEAVVMVKFTDAVSAVMMTSVQLKFLRKFMKGLPVVVAHLGVVAKALITVNHHHSRQYN